ncbi:MAG: serine hydrolase domain-containing protein [Bacillota bacterium]
MERKILKRSYIFLLVLLQFFISSCSNEKKQEKQSSQFIEDNTPAVEVFNRTSPSSVRMNEYFTHLSQIGAFNGVVLFADEGEVIYKRAFGYANFRKKEKLSVNSVFQLASVSKQFTAFAIMMLKEQGKLSFSDSIRKFIPGFPYENITIRQLLTHNSGLPNYMYFADDYWQNKALPMTNDDLIGMIIKNQPKEICKPGRTYLYSNTGYALLASIVEKVSGMRFQRFMREKVFLPLGMTHTFVMDYLEKPNLKNVAMGYEPGRREEPESYQNGVVGDKGVYSTLDDMLKWDQALYQGKLVGKDALEEAFSPAYKRPMPHNYGFGWRIKNASDNEKIVYHGGWWKGYRSYIVRMLGTKRTIIVLINSASHVPFHLEDLQELF